MAETVSVISIGNRLDTVNGDGPAGELMGYWDKVVDAYRAFEGLLASIERRAPVYVAGQLAIEGKEYPICKDLNLPIDDARKNMRR